jgi:transcription-repair coupling factor (superfamily II helicase)
LDELSATWRDRFGPLPEAVENAILMVRIALAGAGKRISSVEVKDGRLMCTRRKELVQVGGRFPRLTAKEPVFKLREILQLVQELPDT